jgi:HMG (high mobility group) box
MHGQFSNHINHQIEHAPMTPFSDAGSDFTIDDNPELNGGHLIDISSSGYAIPTHYMGLPRSHPMQGRYYDAPVFDSDDGYDSRSPSPGIREQVKRPLNAFMLYRKDKQTEIPTSNHQSVSRIIGAMWKSESAETKAKYNSLAQKEREKHRLAYPGYKYSPKKRINKDKKVRRTMSHAAVAKRQEEEKEILRSINKRSESEGTLSKPLPEFLPLPKAKRENGVPDVRPKSKTPVPETVSRVMQKVRSQSAQPSASQDFAKYTSNPQYSPDDVARLQLSSAQLPENFDRFFDLDYPHLAQNGTESVDTSFDSDTESFNREFSADPATLVCSPASFTPFDESQQLYGSYSPHDDVEIFRVNSPFSAEQKSHEFAALQNARVHDVFAGHWSRESTVNPQDLLAQPDNM